MKFTLVNLLLIGIIGLGGRSTSKEPQSELVKAWIDIEKSGRTLIIEARLKNLTLQGLDVRYELETEKKGASGSSSTSQKGTFIVSSQKEIVLSQSRLSVDASDKFRINLSVYNKNELVGKDSVVFHGDIH